MIAILLTACGCEKAINVDYDFPQAIRVPLHKPVSFLAEDFDPTQRTTTALRTFHFYKRRSDGILDYREKI